jgi:hypothetical protein
MLSESLGARTRRHLGQSGETMSPERFSEANRSSGAGWRFQNPDLPDDRWYVDPARPRDDLVTDLRRRGTGTSSPRHRSIHHSPAIDGFSAPPAAP